MISGQTIFNEAFLDSKRLAGDMEADRFIADVFQDIQQKEFLQHWLKSADCSLDTLVRQFPRTVFIAHANRLPEWANLSQMKSGAVFFSRHSEMIMSLLGLLSLPYCYNAANGAMVLYLSERIRKDTAKRLYETALFVWEVMSPHAFLDGGKAYTEILKVRLMHAAIRRYTLSSGKWNDRWGLPVNQEDMAGTNLSFSFIVVRGLRLLGFTISREEQEAFLHLWNVIGYLTGLEDELIAKDPKTARELDRMISKRQFRASAHGRELTGALTAHIMSVNNSKATANDILGLMRYLLGPDIADQLGIDVPQLPAYKLSLLRMVNMLKSMRPQGDPIWAYHQAYRTFRTQKQL